MQPIDILVGSLLWVVLPVLTFGLATPVMCAGAAIRRRSPVLGLAAVVSAAFATHMMRTLDEPGMLGISMAVAFSVVLGATQVLPAARQRREHIDLLRQQFRDG